MTGIGTLKERAPGSLLVSSTSEKEPLLKPRALTQH